MIFNQPLFCITPKALKPINIDFSSRKSLRMINLQMPVSTKHKRIVAFEFISIHDTSSSNSLYRKIQNRFRSHILQNIYPYNTVSFKDSKDRNFVPCSSSSWTFPLSSKIRLINLDFSFKKIFNPFICSNNGHSYQIYSLQHRGITQFNLLSNPPGRDLKFKKLQNPEPLLIRNPQFVNPSSSKVCKGIFAFTTPVSFSTQSVDFIAPTSFAETAVSFPTQFYKEQPCSIFASDKGFKAFYSHLHHYKWCQMFYNYLNLLSAKDYMCTADSQFTKGVAFKPLIK
jgi:hypothetical protein